MENKVDTNSSQENIENVFHKTNNSIESMMINPNNISESKIIVRGQWWSMKDFNNVIEADRKIVVNKKFEFWIHDEVLSFYSDYFSILLSQNITLNASHNNETRTELDDIPHDKKIFDILFWMYSKDPKKLKKAAKTFHDFLQLISLGIFLKLKPEFFEILLNKPAFQWREENFYDPLWSRKVFTFPVLERIVDEMKTNNFTKSIGNIYQLFNFKNSPHFMACRHGLQSQKNNRK